ncbi:MAG: DUF1549 domain-containing protein, partial [Akkermansiaceae bacterium]|nr:DUF1549 domain-containing protein [Akkermansiaceae bacterium]
MPGRRFSVIFLVGTAVLGAAPLDFNDDIRPLLSDRCFKCHGFDGKTREADLRLDVPEGAFAERENGRVIIPGDPAASLLWKRITSGDPDELMPPPDSHLSLSDEEKALLKRWIAEGAEYKKHWALIPVERPALPPVAEGATIRNPLDTFVADRLRSEGLAPSPEAPKRTLIRRLSLDLRGLPPTPEEVAAFLQDESPDAYEQLVDRFLADPAYGERMAWPWLDAARYADSNGYQGDNERTMWPWRDWVVEAFNRNVPWDELTIRQLAGDLLPQAGLEEKLATGFLRNHPINGEGGRIAEENRVDYVMDMAETTGTVWLGLTFNCCRCHDHKYDPITQEEYYGFFAFFNQTPVDGKGGDPQTAPVVDVPDAKQAAREERLATQLAGWRKELEERREALSRDREAWEAATLEAEAPQWTPLEIEAATAKVQTLAVREDRSILAGGANPEKDTYTITAATGLATVTGLRLEALRHETMTHGGLARSNSGNFVLTGIEVEVVTGNRSKPLAIVSAEATYEQGHLKVTAAYDGKPDTGWAVHEGKPVDRDHEAVFRFAKAEEIPAGSVLRVTLRHESHHAHHNLGHFRISVTSAAKPALPGDGATLHTALSTEPGARTDEQRKLIEEAHHRTDAKHRELTGQIEAAQKELAALRESMPKVMVMADRAKRRESFVLDVGSYDKPGKKVTAHTPASLPPMAADLPRNRLGLARWLVSPENPLAARVTVNRFWQEIFGTGLVKSPENFGVQSEMPVYPRLLDWLAAEFMESGWDVKGLVRLIVTSHTYRQSSRVAGEWADRDPGNRLLARGPRFRMPAWMIRDQALA